MRIAMDVLERRPNRFAGKVVLVTGGTQGMGLATAAAFVEEGATVCISGRDAAKGEAAAAGIDQGRGQAHFFKCDITSKGDIERMFAWIASALGGLDCAFNNAGITSPHAPVAESSDESWEEVIRVNLSGTYFCMKQEIRQILESNRGGAIVNNGSLAGLLAIPGQAAYVASKFAVHGLTMGAAIEYARENVRINAIAPGFIAGTGMNSEQKLAANPERTETKCGYAAMNRLGRLEEVAGLVLWLCSDQASFVTGVTIPVDGGARAGKWK